MFSDLSSLLWKNVSLETRNPFSCSKLDQANPELEKNFKCSLFDVKEEFFTRLWF